MGVKYVVPLMRDTCEQVIVERSINLLEPGGSLGLVVPDGLVNNQGDRSNCTRTQSFIAAQGRITGVISLPDHAFRGSGAQHKTSILCFQKFTVAERQGFDREYKRLIRAGGDANAVVGSAVRAAGIGYRTFLGEAAQMGYTPAGPRPQPLPLSNLGQSNCRLTPLVSAGQSVSVAPGGAQETATAGPCIRRGSTDPGAESRRTTSSQR